MTQNNKIPKKQQNMSNGYVSAPSSLRGRKQPDFGLKKFIALPPGFKIKSPGAENDSNLPRKPVPIKAVPLGLDSYAPVNTDYNGEINSFFNQPEPGKETSYSRTGSVSSIDSLASEFSNFSIDSGTGSQGRRRYRKRSQSTPPDLGRQRASPVDRKIEQKIKTEYNQILNQIQKGNLNPNNVSGDRSKEKDRGKQKGFVNIQDWDESSSLDSLDLNDSTDWDVTFNHQSSPITGNHNLGRYDNPSGQTNIMHPQYLTLPRNFLSTHGGNTGSGQVREVLVEQPMLATHQMNGTVPYQGNGLVVYKPLNSGEFIMVGNQDSRGRMPNERPVENHKSSLYKSRGLSSSMPTLLGPNAKGDKKMMKEIKKREKEERKMMEKEEKRRKEEEKRRIQEEKKRRKSILKEQKKLEKMGNKNRTLPKNWAYVNKPIESVYQRPSSHPRPKLSLSAVPIDFEDGPSPRTLPPQQPPPPPPSSMTPSQMLQSDTAARALYASSPDLLRLEQVYGATIRGPSHHSRKHKVPNGPVYVYNQMPPNFVSDYAPRTVVLQKGPEGYGFILRGAKSQSTRNGELDFHPTPEFPALQYLDSVDPGSRADRAGLKGGDFILEINGENVVRASHDRVVQIIRHSGDTLAMKVVTVQKQQTPVNWQHLDGTMTLPTRGTSAISKKQAPQPPRRDPRTSLSKEKGRQIAEGLNELDQLDLALAEFERETNEQPNISTEQKTASIRAKHASKRVSCVDLSNIESHDSDKSEHRGPSERLVHKYSNDRKLSAMDRSQSTPDLSDKKPEPVYATPVVPGSVGAHRKNSNGNVYATPEDNISMKSGMSTMERPKAPPPPPPGASGGKRPAPGLPMDNDTTQTSKAEVVSINTTGSRTSLYARPEKSSQNDDYESSFRPGASAKMTDEPKIKLKTHQRTSSHASTNSGGSRQSDDKHSVSFAEDKVLDNAKTYLQKHPNAKLLVTADIHSDDKKQATSYEPEPDYDMEEDKNKSKVTVISIGDRKMGETESKRFSVRSDIPSANIPPPPSEPAPQPPSMKSKAPSPIKSSAPQPMKATAPQSVMAKSSAPKPPSPKIEHKKQESPKREEPKVGEPAVPAPPAPPPPPVPPLPPSDGPPPLPKTEPPAMTKTEVKAKTENKTPQGVQASDLLAAVQKRQQRMDEDGPKISALPPAKDGAPKDDNQAAIIAAVARRRKMLEEKGEKSIIDSIESRLQKTKKLQSAKLAFSSDNIGNTPEAKRKSATLPDTRVNGKTETKSPTVKTPPKVEAKPISEKPPTKVDVKSSLPPKVEIKPIKTIPIKGKEPTKIMSTVNGTVEKPDIKATEKKVEPIKKEEDSKTNAASTTKAETKDNAQLSPRSTNYVAMAEKARLAYLQKKASQSSLNVSATNNTGKTKPGEKAKTGPTSPVKTGTNSKAPVRDQNKNIISTGTEGKQVFNSDSQIPNGNVKNSNNGDAKSLKQTNNGDNSISIRDRIASINKIEQKKVNSNGKLTNDKISVKGVTVNSSITDKSEKSSVPPPPEFGDSVQVEIIPPPSGFDSGSSFSDISRHSSVLNHEDNESVVSSVSTLSTLSDDQADSGYGRQRHNYEELIAPPPPEFGDSSNQGYETIPSVIPPPPDFGENNSKQISKPFNSKSLDTWQCLDVLDWLDSLKLSQYKTGFQQKCIDGKRLQNLSRNDYIDLGVTQVGHRMNLERSIKKLTLPKNIVSSSHL